MMWVHSFGGMLWVEVALLVCFASPGVWLDLYALDSSLWGVHALDCPLYCTLQFNPQAKLQKAYRKRSYKPLDFRMKRTNPTSA